MAEFYVKVVPDQGAFRVDTSGTYLKVHVTAPASDGQANSELVTCLSTILETDVGIIAGHHSRRKKLIVDGTEQEITAKIAAHTDG